MTAQWPHQVELKLDKVSAAERVRRIEAWCSDWQIGFRVLGTMAEGVIRVAFEEARFARAFHAHFGGVIAPTDELETSLAADAAEVDLYDRLAGEYLREGQRYGGCGQDRIRRAARPAAPG